MEGRHLTRRNGVVFTLALAALSLGLAPGIAIADGVSTSSIETLGQATEVAANSTSALSQSVSGTTQSATGLAEDVTSDTTQAVSDTTQAVSEVVPDAASGGESNLNGAGAVVDKNASSTLSPGLATGSSVQGGASGTQVGGATTTAPESTTVHGDPVASGADPRLVRSWDPMRIDRSVPYSATGSGSANACPRVGAMCTAEASSSIPGSLGDAVVSAIRWLATTGLDILFKLVLAFGLALAGALGLEAARRQQAIQPWRQEGRCW